MKSHFYHLQLNISFSHLPFYKDLMGFLGWSIIFETPDTIGFKSDRSGDVWFVDNMSTETLNYDKKGINHLSIRVEKQENVGEKNYFLFLKNAGISNSSLLLSS
jgi:hypothetical protein